MTKLLLDYVKDAKTIGISGHIHPDGDCIGSVLSCYMYLKNALPLATIHAYAESVSNSFTMLSRVEELDTSYSFPEEPYDVFISLDCGSIDRLGRCQDEFLRAKRTVSFDHHITNTNFADENIVNAAASSTSEVLFDHMERELIDLPIAEALYLGIMHDTGVFKYSCTSEKTMCTVGYLMSKGIDTASLVDKSFYMKSFIQLKTLGCALSKAELGLGGKMIYTILTQEDIAKIGARMTDTEGIVSELRTTEGVEAAVFIREEATGVYKFSLRSNGLVDVSTISSSFGGGGHKMAAGFTAEGSLDEIFTQVSAMIMLQI